jgi:hypothetical protein
MRNPFSIVIFANLGVYLRNNQILVDHLKPICSFSSHLEFLTVLMMVSLPFDVVWSCLIWL